MPHTFRASFLNYGNCLWTTGHCGQPGCEFHKKILEACNLSDLWEKRHQRRRAGTTAEKIFLSAFWQVLLCCQLASWYIFSFLWPKSIYKTYIGPGLCYWAATSEFVTVHATDLFHVLQRGETHVLNWFVDLQNIRAGKALLFIKSCNFFKSQMRWKLGPRKSKWFVWGLSAGPRATTRGAKS